MIAWVLLVGCTQEVLQGTSGFQVASATATWCAATDFGPESFAIRVASADHARCSPTTEGSAEDQLTLRLASCTDMRAFGCELPAAILDGHRTVVLGGVVDLDADGRWTGTSVGVAECNPITDSVGESSLAGEVAFDPNEGTAWFDLKPVVGNESADEALVGTIAVDVCRAQGDSEQ